MLSTTVRVWARIHGAVSGKSCGVWGTVCVYVCVWTRIQDSFKYKSCGVLGTVVCVCGDAYMGWSQSELWCVKYRCVRVSAPILRSVSM